MARKEIQNRRWIFLLTMIPLVFILIQWLPFSKTLELKTQDWRFLIRGRSQHTSPITIVTIDDASFAYLKKRWPWSRTLLTQAIQFLIACEAKVIGVDIMLSEEGYSKEEDAALAKVISNANHIILSMKFGTRRMDGYKRDYLDAPLPEFDPELTRSGFINVIFDTDGRLRDVKPMEKFQDSDYFPFFLKLVSVYREQKLSVNDQGEVKVGDFTLPVTPRGVLKINYIGPAGSFKTVPFYKLMNGKANKNDFKGKIVIMGAYFKESHDHFMIPFYDDENLMYGVEIHANAVNTVLNNTFIQTSSYRMTLAIILLILISFSILLTRINPYKGFLVTLAAILVYFLISVFIFIQFKLLIDTFQPVMSLFLVYIGSIIYHYLIVEKERSRVKNIFSRYVSPRVVEQILAGHEEVSLGGEVREVTLFFSDIRDFTSTSEKMPAQKLVEMLNTYFSQMTEIIFKYEGTLDKFIGDAILAFFGAPIGQNNASERSVRMCLEMRNKLAEMNASRAKQNREPLRIGMALHKGSVVVGNIGSPRQMGYTVIGDAVNVCSRIESLTKKFKTDLLISDAVYQEVKDIIEVETLAPEPIRGKSESIRLYKLLSLKKA